MFRTSKQKCLENYFKNVCLLHKDVSNWSEYGPVQRDSHRARHLNQKRACLLPFFLINTATIVRSKLSNESDFAKKFADVRTLPRKTSAKKTFCQENILPRKKLKLPGTYFTDLDLFVERADKSFSRGPH